MSHGGDDTERLWHVRLTGRLRLAPFTFELRFTKPPDFSFEPGQFTRWRASAGQKRDYTLTSGPQEETIALCVKAAGGFSTRLTTAAPGEAFTFTGPLGYFVHRWSDAASVFVATGAGIAPFAAMARSGISGFVLLHGVARADHLMYGDLLRRAAGQYVPCLSAETPKDLHAAAFHGRVTRYLDTLLPEGRYDFYLCGGRGMIRDAMAICDERFPDSRVFTEAFY